MEYYFYILAVLIVLIVGVIGFLVDSKNKKKRSEVKEEINSNAGQAVNNIDPLQNAPVNNSLNNEILNMQPIGSENNLVQNQVQPQVQNNSMPVSDSVNTNVGVVANESTSVATDSILGMEPINNMDGSDLNISNHSVMPSVNNQAVMSSVQTNLSNAQGSLEQVMEPIQSIEVNNGMNQEPSNSLGGINDISVLQGIQPVMTNSNVVSQTSNNVAVPVDNQTVMQNMQSDVMNTGVNPIPNLNVQPQMNNGINQQENMQNVVPTMPVIEGIPQINNQNLGMGNNVVGAPQNNVNANVQTVPNPNMNQQVNGQVYATSNSQPFDISSMFGNNQQ